MALCESQLDSVLPQLKCEESSPCSEESKESPEKKQKLEHNGDAFPREKAPPPLKLDYRSPMSHFIPPAVEMYAAMQSRSEQPVSATDSTDSPTPVKRKRGRPRVDKTSPEYLAKSAARKQAKEMAAMMSNRSAEGAGGEKRKRGRPRIDKTSPEYLARKRARELEALERKAKREYKRRTTADSAASSSTNDGTPRVKRKYTKRAPSAKKNDGTPGAERVKGKRGRPRKVDMLAANNMKQNNQQPKIRVRSNLMPENTEPISLDSDDDLGSPGQASDSFSLDENLRALRHIHEKYANIDKDDLYEAHLLAANFKKPPSGGQQRLNREDDDVLSVKSSEGRASVKELDTRVEKLEDSSGSDSDSSSSGSDGSSSSDSSSSSGSGSSSSSEGDGSSSEDESGDERRARRLPDRDPRPDQQDQHRGLDDDRSFGAWSSLADSRSGLGSEAEGGSGSESDPEARAAGPPPPRAPHDDISESENESPDKSFQCHICRKWYSTRVTLKIHRRVHQSRGTGASRSRARSSDRYECDCCSETFSRREKLLEHKADAHRGAMTVRCSVCRRCFEDEAELAAHDRAHTDDERAGRCSVCGATFTRWELLRRHRSVSHGGGAGTGAGAGGAGAGGGAAGGGGGGGGAGGARLAHACAQCGKRFSHPHSLSRHMQNHAKQLYRCVVCKASFARADLLAQHLNSHLANYKRLKN